MDYVKQREYLTAQLATAQPDEHLVKALELIDGLLLQQDEKKEQAASRVTSELVDSSLTAIATMKQACDKALMNREDHGVIENCVAKLRAAIDELKKHVK